MNIEKEKQAIERLRAFQPKDGSPYYLCYSGGKDSDVIRILASLAGVLHEIHHNLTSVDAPETVQYVKSISGVHIDRARYADGSPKTMWNLIPKKKLPPTRLMRWCCSELKEGGGKGRLKVTGVRWAESVARKKRSGLVQIIGKPVSVQKFLEENQMNYHTNPHGGIVLNHDNSESRRAVEHCYRTTSTMVNPIIDWNDSDVWAFLRFYGCSANPLYQCGESRVGCIGCPLSQQKNMKKDFLRYPRYKKNYIAAFDRMLAARRAAGLENRINWQTGADVMKWWLGDDIDQFTMFDEEELTSIFSDMGF